MVLTEKTNKLALEKSPYLLQHAHNPVNWYPWGEEAFAQAKAENKPVFLSIGYSTCHWCHVMAHESFEDEAVAQFLNANYIAIKVDREERPDVDAIYMQVCQAMTGHGGWPLSVFLTSDKKPFYAGTYFPPQGRFGRPGFIDVLSQLKAQYDSDPQRIAQIGQRAVDSLAHQPLPEEPEIEKLLKNCFRQLEQSFDGEYGGFGTEPKFPTPHLLTFLMRWHRAENNERALSMVLDSLEAMANGGIYDHIGFGFSRYSVDRRWLVPHFEKMLYDNALLLMAYTEAYQLTLDTRWQKIAGEIITYLKRDMTHPQGGFYSAEDADSEGEEGLFYIWDQKEVMEVLGSETGELYCEAYDISSRGNFEGKNISNLIRRDLEALAEAKGLSGEQLQSRLEGARQKLFEVRERRVRPHRDDKILTAWNALMIAALAKAGRVFGNPEYTGMAIRAYRFIEESLTENGRLMVRWREGEVKNQGYLDDYAFMLWAALELHDTTLDTGWLGKAKTLADNMLNLFWDDNKGGFWFYGNDAEELILRPKEVYDGAMPSGNSVAALQLLRLARLTGREEYADKVSQLFRAFGSQVSSHPSGFTYMMQAMLYAARPGKEVVVLGDQEDKEVQKLVYTMQRFFLPEVAWLVADDPGELQEAAPFAAQFSPGDKPIVYVCENYACSRPSTDLDQVLTQIIQ